MQNNTEQLMADAIAAIRAQVSERGRPEATHKRHNAQLNLRARHPALE
jgi:hypothetical protein